MHITTPILYLTSITDQFTSYKHQNYVRLPVLAFQYITNFHYKFQISFTYALQPPACIWNGFYCTFLIAGYRGGYTTDMRKLIHSCSNLITEVAV